MRRSLYCSIAGAALGIAATVQAQAPVDISPTRLADGVYMLMGTGGNIGLSVGADGAFLIDDQFAYQVENIKAAVAKVTEDDIKFLVNTHWHFDHTGGNEKLGDAGTLIVAHENVRKRMSTEQFIEAFNRRQPAAPASALPVITFAEAMTFHWNGDALRIFHVEHAHTDGDSIIHFTKANVVHMGDTFFNKMYPFIDTSSGGSIDGMIAAVDRVLPMVNGETKIIPGHGPLATRDDLRAYRAMLATARDAVKKLVDAGKTRDEVIAAKPTQSLDEKWGGGFMRPDVWTGIVYDSLVRRPVTAK